MELNIGAIRIFVGDLIQTLRIVYNIFMEDITKCQEEINTILKKYGFEYTFNITFPQYNILPDTLALALKVISRETLKIIPVLVKKEDQ